MLYFFLKQLGIWNVRSLNIYFVPNITFDTGGIFIELIDIYSSWGYGLGLYVGFYA